MLQLADFLIHFFAQIFLEEGGWCGGTGRKGKEGELVTAASISTQWYKRVSG